MIRVSCNQPTTTDIGTAHCNYVVNKHILIMAERFWFPVILWQQQQFVGAELLHATSGCWMKAGCHVYLIEVREEGGESEAGYLRSTYEKTVARYITTWICGFKKAILLLSRSDSVQKATFVSSAFKTVQDREKASVVTESLFKQLRSRQEPDLSLINRIIIWHHISLQTTTKLVWDELRLTLKIDK